MRRVALTRGRFALVDDADYAMVNAYKWHVSGRYAYTNLPTGNPKKRQYKMPMHRLIMDPPEGTIIDHINRRSFDNRRSNLRFATTMLNSWNRKDNVKHRVYWHTGQSAYLASVYHPGGKIVYLGYHRTKRKASAACAAYLKQVGNIHDIAA